MSSENERPQGLKSRIRRWYSIYGKLLASISIAGISLGIGILGNIVAGYFQLSAIGEHRVALGVGISLLSVVVVLFYEYRHLEKKQSKEGKHDGE